MINFIKGMKLKTPSILQIILLSDLTKLYLWDLVYYILISYNVVEGKNRNQKIVLKRFPKKHLYWHSLIINGIASVSIG